MQYPLALAVEGETSIVIVDLNLPGIWRLPLSGGTPQLVYRGSNLLRKPLNRPRCIAVSADGSLLVGDTATREIYRLAADGSGEALPLTNGFLGIPNSLALDSKGRLLISDLETRFVYAWTEGQSEPQLFSKTSTRGLHLAADGVIWGVTPDAVALVRFNESGEASAVLGGRPFQFPHNVVVDAEGTAFVTDGYAKTVWRIPNGGTPEPFFAGEPLQNPVGLAMIPGKLLIADPHAKQIFAIDLASKMITPLVQ
jgi:sugar lactone lactonase YvrE